MSKSFRAQVSSFVAEYKARQDAVLRNSVQQLFSIAQTTVYQGGNLPIDTGFLRNSLVSEVNGQRLGKGEKSYELFTTSAKVGDVLFGGWTADYALRMEHGFVGEDKLGRTYNQSGFGFAASAAAQWVEIVDRNCVRLRELSA